MKKTNLMFAAFLFVAMSAMAQSGYVDLGLSSGTYWKATNESGFYDYDAAVSKFGNKLPTTKQLQELKNECEWTWTGNGYKVTGPNGESIKLPAAGYRFGAFVHDVQSGGYYWCATEGNSDCAYYLFFNSDEAYVSYGYRSNGRSVRLVQN